MQLPTDTQFILSPRTPAYAAHDRTHRHVPTTGGSVVVRWVVCWLVACMLVGNKSYPEHVRFTDLMTDGRMDMSRAADWAKQIEAAFPDPKEKSADTNTTPDRMMEDNEMTIQSNYEAYYVMVNKITTRASGSILQGLNAMTIHIHQLHGHFCPGPKCWDKRRTDRCRRPTILQMSRLNVTGATG